jgi:hypothetical protein
MVFVHFSAGCVRPGVRESVVRGGAFSSIGVVWIVCKSGWIAASTLRFMMVEGLATPIENE